MGHHVGPGLQKTTVYRTVARINREEPRHHKRGRYDVPRAHTVAAQLGDNGTSRYFHGKTNGSNEM